MTYLPQGVFTPKQAEDIQAKTDNLLAFPADIDGVYVDETTGVAGTAWPIGSAGTPVDNISDALTIAVARKLRKIYVYGYVELLSSVAHYEFIGMRRGSVRDEVDISGQDVDHCTFRNLFVELGAAITSIQNAFENCTIYDMVVGSCKFYNCNILGVNVHAHQFFDCYWDNATLDATGIQTILSIAKGSGKVTITNLTNTSGAGWVIYGDGLDLTLAASCTGGTINIFGNVKVTDNSAGTTVNDYTVETKVDAITGLSAFKQETVAATDVNGTTWKDLLDKSTITKPTKIYGFKVTVAGTWAGKAQVRITDGAGTKIFPFQDQYEEDAEFTSGTQVVFNFPVVVPVADGYKFQFRSTDVADGAGDTLALNNLDVIEAG